MKFITWHGLLIEVAEGCSPSHLGLEAAEELGQVGVLPGQSEDALLGQGAVHVVVLQDHVLLQDLHRVNLIRTLELGQHHLRGGGNSQLRGSRGMRLGQGRASRSGTE